MTLRRRRCKQEGNRLLVAKGFSFEFDLLGSELMAFTLGSFMGPSGLVVA